MKYFICLVTSLFFVFSVGSAIAGDLQPFAKMTDQELSSVQGGASTNTIILNLPGLSFFYTETTTQSKQIFQGEITKTNGTYIGRWRSNTKPNWPIWNPM